MNTTEKMRDAMYAPTLMQNEDVVEERNPLWRGLDFRGQPNLAMELFRRAQLVRLIRNGAPVQRWVSVDEMIELSAIAFPDEEDPRR